MFGWIPIIGPIIQGLFGFLNKFQDKQIEQIKAGAATDIAATQASVQIIHDTQDDIGVRLTRDIIMFPVAVWTALISYDTIVVHDHPNWIFLTVEKYPPTLEYLPYAVITFLLGWTATKVFR